MLKKPRRGWWVLPGGKVEPHEPWPVAARREMLEEAGLTVSGLTLRGIHSLHIRGDGANQGELYRLIAQFSAREVCGDMFESCKEGVLGLVRPEDIPTLPMDEGDRRMVQQTLRAMEQDNGTVYFGRFTYNADHELLDWSMEPTAQGLVDVPVSGEG